MQYETLCIKILTALATPCEYLNMNEKIEVSIDNVHWARVSLYDYIYLICNNYVRRCKGDSNRYAIFISSKYNLKLMTRN